MHALRRPAGAEEESDEEEEEADRAECARQRLDHLGMRSFEGTSLRSI